MLTFDEGTHQYWWDERRVVNVTLVLDRLLHIYDGVPAETLERARQQGIAIHRTIEWHLKSTLDTCPAWLLPYIAAWQQFERDSAFQLESSEQRLYHRLFDYAGTADLFGWMRVGRRAQHKHVCIDIKRSFLGGASIGLQTAAYAGAYNQDMQPDDFEKRIEQRFAIRFLPGKSPPYQLLELNDRDDFLNWTSLLRSYRWMEKHGYPNSIDTSGNGQRG